MLHDGGYVRVWDPEHGDEIKAKDPDGDGVYTDQHPPRVGSIDNVKFYDANWVFTTEYLEARYAILTAHNGKKLYYDMMITNPGSNHRHGRCTKIEDRNANYIEITYKYPVGKHPFDATDEDLDYSRQKL